MNYAQRMKLLQEKLRNSNKVNSYDKGDEKESDTIAHALLDLEESFHSISNLVKKLESNRLNEEGINDILTDIGEDLRHILYHIADMKYYGYLQELGAGKRQVQSPTKEGGAKKFTVGVREWEAPQKKRKR